MIRPFIGAYWSQRKESRPECATRLAKLLEGISSEGCGDRWFLPVKSRSKEPQQVLSADKSSPAIEALLRANNRDRDGMPIPQLGFSLYLWNGDYDRSIALHATCGAYSEFVKNSIVLELPAIVVEENAAEVQRLESLLKLFVFVWEPESAVVSSAEELARSPGKPAAEVEGLFAYRAGKWTSRGRSFAQSVPE
jgi:hypothetical protein